MVQKQGDPPSSNRRRDFGALVGRERLEKEVAAVLGLLRTLSPTPEVLRDVGTQEVAAVARWAAREFRERYVGTGGVAPPEWGWHPLNGVVTSQTGVSPPEWGCHVQRGLSLPKWQVSLQKWGLSPHKGGERVWKGPPPRPLGGQYCVSCMATTVSAGHRPPPCPSQGIPWAASPCPLDESQEGPSAGQMPPSPHGHCHVPKEFLVPPCPQGLGGHLHPIVLAECPAIVPRCLWGACSYRGTPSPLRPPLGSVFLHHTLEPARPCRTFSACAHAMRDMQRFHQDTRGWDDIGYRSLSLPLVPVTSHGPWHPPVGLGIVPLWALPPPLSPLTVPVTPAGLRHPPWSPSLSPCSPRHCPSTVPPLSPSCPRSFVVGSDGYLYEGRGWHWVGAHTKATTPEASALASSMTSRPPCRTPTPWPWCGTSSCPAPSAPATSSRTSPCAATASSATPTAPAMPSSRRSRAALASKGHRWPWGLGWVTGGVGVTVFGVILGLTVGLVHSAVRSGTGWAGLERGGRGWTLVQVDTSPVWMDTGPADGGLMEPSWTLVWMDTKPMDPSWTLLWMAPGPAVPQPGKPSAQMTISLATSWPTPLAQHPMPVAPVPPKINKLQNMRSGCSVQSKGETEARAGGGFEVLGGDIGRDWGPPWRPQTPVNEHPAPKLPPAAPWDPHPSFRGDSRSHRHSSIPCRGDPVLSPQ